MQNVDAIRERQDAIAIDALVGNSISTIRAEDLTDDMSLSQMMDWVDVSDVIETLPEPLKTQFIAHYRSEVVDALVRVGDDS